MQAMYITECLKNVKSFKWFHILQYTPYLQIHCITNYHCLQSLYKSIDAIS